MPNGSTSAAGTDEPGYWVSQALYVAAKLGLADLLTAGPRSVSDLVQATKAYAPSLYRLLRALASLGVFSEDRNGSFSLPPLLLALPISAPNFHSHYPERRVYCGEIPTHRFSEVDHDRICTAVPGGWPAGRR